MASSTSVPPPASNVPGVVVVVTSSALPVSQVVGPAGTFGFGAPGVGVGVSCAFWPQATSKERLSSSDEKR